MRGPTLNTPIPPGHQMALWQLGDRVFQVQNTAVLGWALFEGGVCMILKLTTNLRFVGVRLSKRLYENNYFLIAYPCKCLLKGIYYLLLLS